jgi:hypothetical protein
MATDPSKPSDRPAFDLGHREDFGYTQIDLMLRLTPAQRLDLHEGWRLFVKEALRNAALRQGEDCPAR